MTASVSDSNPFVERAGDPMSSVDAASSSVEATCKNAPQDPGQKTAMSMEVDGLRQQSGLAESGVKEKAGANCSTCQNKLCKNGAECEDTMCKTKKRVCHALRQGDCENICPGCNRKRCRQSWHWWQSERLGLPLCPCDQLLREELCHISDEGLCKMVSKPKEELEPQFA